jgi:hypothetical protein
MVRSQLFDLSILWDKMSTMMALQSTHLLKCNEEVRLHSLQTQFCLNTILIVFKIVSASYFRNREAKYKIQSYVFTHNIKMNIKFNFVSVYNILKDSLKCLR